jgi:hypothetical protein
MFEPLQVLRSERPAMCPECLTPKHAFVRTLKGGMMCVVCSEKPRPIAKLSDVEFPSRRLGHVVRHGAPVVCTGCEKERAVFSLASGLCLKCHA